MSEPGNSDPGSTAQRSAAGAQPGSAQPGGPGARQDQPVNPRSRGVSPARDAREAAGGQQAEQTIKIGDQDYTAETVKEAIAAKAAADVRKSGLPADPNGYKIELPPNWKAPEGTAFELNTQDPGLSELRNLAHRRGFDQETVSELLGIYAANKVGEFQNTQKLIAANREKLGSAADARMNAIEQWMTAIAGAKAKPLMTALKQYPMVETVEALETVIRKFSNQGGAEFSQSHREQPAEQGKIPGYDQMNFMQRRAAQDQANTRGGPRR